MSGPVSQQVKERIKKLRAVIDHHRYLYHVLDKQEISEAALDSLKHELKQLEEAHPELITPDSPTQRVAGAPLPGFKKVRHQVTQWSFDDAFSQEEIRAFDARVKKILGRASEYVCELKIDGFKIILTYQKGLLQTAATRGNGLVGEDVTANIKTIESVPLSLRDSSEDLVVEGEIWLGKKAFTKLNQEQKKKGEPLFANPRNTAAGTIRQLDPRLVAGRGLDSFIYDLAFSSGGLPPTQIAELKRLQELGFKVNPYFEHCSNIEAVIKYWQKWGKKNKSQDYWLDGVVVKINDGADQEKLGYTGKAPRFALAFKFAADQATTVVEEIIFQIGRTGVITPVAKLRPVLLAGSTVARATLHNEDEIKRLDLRIGDTVIIQKAGDVIPDIVSVLKDLRPKSAKLFSFPKSLPGIGQIKRPPGAAAHRAVNRETSAQIKRRFYHFVGKSAFDITHLGPKMIDLLLGHKLVSSYADIFKLTKADLLSLPRLADKSAANIIQAIGEKRTITLTRFIVALSIPQVGEETAEDLANHFRTTQKLSQAEAKELSQIEGVGPIVAVSVYDWFRNKDNQKLLKELLAQVKVEKVTAPTSQSGRLTGQTFVLTGTLESLTRDEAKKQIKALGGSVASSVSAKTDYLVAGADPGTKYAEAQKLGVKILSEKDFLKLL